MEFSLTEQEGMLQKQAREFAQRVVLPRASEIDRSDEFPLDLARELGRVGYRGLPFPTSVGGSGAGYLSYVLVLEQVCQASVMVGAIMAINTVPSEAVFRFGREEQKQAFLVPLAEGRLLGTIAFTEAETGSDPRAITTHARWRGEGWAISGQKHFVSLAPAANLALVFAKEDTGRLSAFILECSKPGWSIGEKLTTMGLKGLGTSSVNLEDVPATQLNQLGERGRGFDVLLEAISLGRLGVATEGVGVAQAALDLAIDYAKKRRALGKPIAELISIQWLLAEMASRLEAGRWLVYRTASLRDEGKSIRYETSLAKLYCSQMAVEVTRMAMQVHGSYGTLQSLPVERLYRDAKMLEIYVGISEIQRNIIASQLSGG